MDLGSSLESLKSVFSSCVDKKEMLELLVEYGKDLPDYPEEWKDDAHQVKGCQATVFIAATEKEGAYSFSGWSNAHIIKGFLAIILKAVDGITKADIPDAEEKIMSFLEDTGLNMSELTMRANTFGNIWEKVKDLMQA